MATRQGKTRPRASLAPFLATFVSGLRSDPYRDSEIDQFRRGIREAGEEWFNAAFLDDATPGQLIEKVTRFASDHAPQFVHTDAIARNPALLRHGLTHLLRGSDEPWRRFARCVEPAGPYFIPGLGRRFWGTLFPCVVPERFPVWLPETERGMVISGATGDCPPRRSVSLEHACRIYESLLGADPTLTAGQLDAFFIGVAGMTGREVTPITPGSLAGSARDKVARAVRAVRTAHPLRKRLTDWGERLNRYRARFREAVRTGDDATLTAILREVCARVSTDRDCGNHSWPRDSAASMHETYLASVESSDVPPGFIELVTRIGLGPSAAVSHLANPAVFPLASATLTRAAGTFDDAFVDGLSPDDEYRLLASWLRHLRTRHRVHPLEFADVVEAVAAEQRPDPPAEAGSFGGFCTDTFRFFADLAAANSRSWMDSARPRYRFAVREPLVELCSALTARYVVPVLAGEYGWDVECDPRPGKALTSICKNDYGRSAPYQPALWLTFYPRSAGTRRLAVQFFVRADGGGLWYGFLLGPHARTAGRRFRQAVQRHAESLFRALESTDATTAVTFAGDDALTTRVELRSPEDLRDWATGRTLVAGRFRPPSDPLLRGEELVGEVLLAFDRLVPLFAAAVEDDPLPVLDRRSGSPADTAGYDPSAFVRDTFLTKVWLNRAVGLLGQKGQLVLYGLPGTGKTHVASRLARLLTRGRVDRVEFIQFHPGYGYADLIEGPDPESPSGYRDGILCQFAARAAVRPAEPFVLVIDEITRADLPRVFGELLYLLEYRGHTVTLPFSRRAFRLPENLRVIATANVPFGSEALDAALRRRFAFMELGPDPAVLAKWLDAHPPADADPAFGPRVIEAFEKLNARVARDFGPGQRFGHSAFMIAGLNADKLRAVWDHTVIPAVAALAQDRRAVLPGYELDRILGGEAAPPRWSAVPVGS